MTDKKFITVHIVNDIPLHNLNRDQNGLPKSQFDGGVQRARLSAQSLKRAARVAYRDMGHDESQRTRQAETLTLAAAAAYATQHNLPFDEAAAKKTIKSVIKSLTNDAGRDEEKAKTAAEAGTDAKDSDNIIFLSRAEIATLAAATVDKQQDGTAPTLDDLVADAASPSLDVAAFGRMFAKATEKGTHAAVAVSHATTTHQMTLVADYFSAVEDAEQSHAGAAHIGMSYYTSGVYYRSYTIDVDQLKRSWTIFDTDGAPAAFAALNEALIRALPSGKATNTAPYKTPALVLVETQGFRTAYGFDAPVVPAVAADNNGDGGYTKPTVVELGNQRQQAVAFDPDNFGPCVVYGNTYDTDFNATPVDGIKDLVQFIVDATFNRTASAPANPGADHAHTVNGHTPVTL